MTCEENVHTSSIILDEALELMMMTIKSTVMMSSIHKKKNLRHVPNLSSALHINMDSTAGTVDLKSVTYPFLDLV
jgi:hypothetical protein